MSSCMESSYDILTHLFSSSSFLDLFMTLTSILLSFLTIFLHYTSIVYTLLFYLTSSNMLTYALCISNKNNTIGYKTSSAPCFYSLPGTKLQHCDHILTKSSMTYPFKRKRQHNRYNFRRNSSKVWIKSHSISEHNNKQLLYWQISTNCNQIRTTRTESYNPIYNSYTNMLFERM